MGEHCGGLWNAVRCAAYRENCRRFVLWGVGQDSSGLQKVAELEAVYNCRVPRVAECCGGVYASVNGCGELYGIA